MSFRGQVFFHLNDILLSLSFNYFQDEVYEL